MHGIIHIHTNPHQQKNHEHQNGTHVGAENFLPLPSHHINKYVHRFQQPIPRSLAGMVRGFKTGVTKWSRTRGNHYMVWQRNYHDRIIRDNRALHAIRHYIQQNPTKWYRDRNNHEHIFM